MGKRCSRATGLQYLAWQPSGGLWFFQVRRTARESSGDKVFFESSGVHEPKEGHQEQRCPVIIVISNYIQRHTEARLRDIVQYRAGGIRTLMRLLSADFKSSGLHTQRDHNIQYLCCCALLCVVCSSLCSFLPFQRVFWTENPFHSSEKSAGLRVRNPGTTRINLVRAIPFRGDMCVHNGKYIRSRELVKPTRFLSAVHVGSLWAVLRLPDLRQLSGAELHPSKRCSSPSSSS